MKKIIAIAAIIASAQASAFFDNSNGNMNGANNGSLNTAGNATGEGEATFSMDMNVKTKQHRNVGVNVKGNNEGTAYATEAPYAPVAPAAK
jgi:hypothetical protein